MRIDKQFPLQLISEYKTINPGGAVYMPRIKQVARSEGGTILLVTLMVFMLIGIMSASLIKTGFMEYKSSHFENMVLQAQQGADAAVEWGEELIYLELNQFDYLSLDELPAQLYSGNRAMNIGNTGCSIMVGDIVKINELGQEPNYCTYEFIASGLYNGARRQVKVQIIYHFSGGYETIDSEGNAVFVPREYLDRGKITSYQPYY